MTTEEEISGEVSRPSEPSAVSKANSLLRAQQREQGHYKVAAAIVTYKSPIEGVRKAVESYLDTTLKVHLTIVDNASGEEYFRELKQLEREHVTVLTAPRNGGFGYGNNYAMLRAPACDYFLFMNPDVIVHENALETLVDYLEKHPGTGVVSPKVLYEDGTLQPLNKRAPTVTDLFLRRFAPHFIQQVPLVRKRMEYYMMLDVGYDKPCEVEFMTGCFMLFKKKVLDRVGGFDERFFMYLEDADITLRTREHYRAMYVPDAVITHSWRRGSHKSLRLMLVMLHSMLVYFCKWGVKWW